MAIQHEVGDRGEEVARQYLIGKGYKIAENNWHHGHLELDIIAWDGDELVIVEVKSRTGIPYDHPSEAITKKKINMIIEAADAYLQQHNLTCETRFDLITVIFIDNQFELEHFPEAFYPML